MANTPNLGISHIDSNQNQKEVTANTGFDQLDTAMTDLLVKPLTGDYTLTAVEATTFFAIQFTGTLAGCNIFTQATVRKVFAMQNGTTGPLIVKPTGGTSSVIIQPDTSSYTLIYSDGVNCVKLAAMPAKGSTTLAAGFMSDVVITSPVDGQSLKYDISSTSWKNKSGVTTQATLTATTVLSAFQGAKLLTADATSGLFAVDLPAASTCAGARLALLKVDGTNHPVTLVPFGSDTINGVPNSVSGYSLFTKYQFVIVECDGTNWYIVGSVPSTLISSITAATTLTTAISKQLVKCNATGGAFTATLPDATACGGSTIVLKKTDASANAVTVAGFSVQTIDGAATFSLSALNKFVELTSDGNNWLIVGQN